MQKAGAKRFQVKEHQVLSHTTTFGDGRHGSVIFLFDPADPGRGLKVFKGWGGDRDEAETAAVAQAVTYLDLASSVPDTVFADRATVMMAGRVVDVFCDAVGNDSYQAFPFLRKEDGTHGMIIEFHLHDVVTGSTPAAAIRSCIHRLQDFFALESTSAA